MKVQCILCDKIEEIPDESPLSKRLRNRPIHTYMCQTCHTRITEKTLKNKRRRKDAFA